MARHNLNLWAANIEQNKTICPPKMQSDFPLPHILVHHCLWAISAGKPCIPCTVDLVLIGCWNIHFLRLSPYRLLSMLNHSIHWLPHYLSRKTWHTCTVQITDTGKRLGADRLLLVLEAAKTTACVWPSNKQPVQPGTHYCLMTSGSTRVGFVA